MVFNAETSRHPAKYVRDAQNAKAGGINSVRGEKRGEIPKLWNLCDALRPPRLCDERLLSKKDTTGLRPKPCKLYKLQSDRSLSLEHSKRILRSSGQSRSAQTAQFGVSGRSVEAFAELWHGNGSSLSGEIEVETMGGNMATLHATIHTRADANQVLPSNGTLGEIKMARLASMLYRLAPKPGALVYLDSANLPIQLGDTRPTVFSAFDACTHIQIARVYLTDSFASAADFLDFVRRKLPFRISRIRTAAKEPFWVDPLPSPVRRFTSHLEAQGVLHMVVTDRSQDDFFSVFDHLTFVHQAGSSHRSPAIPELVGELIAFLYFHNNNRTMASLKGKTPVEKLKTFPGFEEVLSFDPFAPEPLHFEPHTPPPVNGQEVPERISA